MGCGSSKPGQPGTGEEGPGDAPLGRLSRALLDAAQAGDEAALRVALADAAAAGVLAQAMGFGGNTRRTALDRACRAASRPCVAALLAASTDQLSAVQGPPKLQELVIHTAAATHGAGGAVSELLAAARRTGGDDAVAAQLRATDSNGRTPLAVAAMHGNDDCCGALLRDGGALCDVEAADADGNSVLLLAAGSFMRKGTAALQVLVDAGADVRAAAPSDGQTALHRAAAIGDVGAVRLLLRAGADAAAVDKSGHDAWVYAARDSAGEDNWHDVAAVLNTLRPGSACSDPVAGLALLTAADNGDFDAAQRILEGDVDVDCDDGEGDATEAIGAAGAAAAAGGGAAGDGGGDGEGAVETDEVALVVADATDAAERAADLCKFRRNYATPSPTPLHIACTRGHVPIVELLARASVAQLTATDSRCYTPLRVAVAHDRVEVLEALLAAAASPVVAAEAAAVPDDKQQRTVWHAACARGRAGCVRALLKAVDADALRVAALVDSVDAAGNTAALLAVKGGRHEALELVLEATADGGAAQARGPGGNGAPMEAALEAHDATACQLLLSHGAVDAEGAGQLLLRVSEEAASGEEDERALKAIKSALQGVAGAPPAPAAAPAASSAQAPPLPPAVEAT